MLIQMLFLSLYFVRINIFPTWKTNMTKIHLRTWLMNTKEALRECFCSYVEVMVKRDLSWIQALFLTCSFLFTPPMKPSIFRHDCRKRCSLQTTTDMKGGCMKWDGGKKHKNPKFFKSWSCPWWVNLKFLLLIYDKIFNFNKWPIIAWS